MFRSLLEGVPVPVVLFDPDTWRPIEFNARAAEFMGYAPQEFARLTITDLEAVPNPEETVAHVSSIRRTQEDEFVRLHRKQDGTVVRVLIRVAWADWNGRCAMMTTWEHADGVDAGGIATDSPPAIVDSSPAIVAAVAMLDQVARTDVTALIFGETGVGKERFARALHERSRRSDGPFIAVNCAALPQALIESELFGHELGAFTGATTRRRGCFALADGGTLLLDEVGDLPLEAQSKLLRVLEERAVRPIGAELPVPVDARVIAATNRDLIAMVEADEFRRDLYYRLAAFPLRVPPLRERREDIPRLVEQFVADNARRLGRPLTGFAACDLERLQQYDWPGNVRELSHVVERAAILCDDSRLVLAPDSLGSAAGAPPLSEAPQALDDLVSRHIRRVLDSCGWVIEGPNGAAARLDLKASTLRYRMQKLGIQRAR